MKTYMITLKIDNHFDSLNRVFNKFCGREFKPFAMHMNAQQSDETAVVSITMNGQFERLQLVLKKLLAYTDVHRVLTIEEVKKLRVS